MINPNPTPVNMSPTFVELCSQLQQIVAQMNEIGYKPSKIVGLTRGGLIPAVILSHLFKVPMHAINWSASSGKGAKDYNSKLNPAELPKLSGKSKILIVDDICDSGETIKGLTKALNNINQGASIKSAVLYFKDLSNGIHHNDPEHCYIPDFYSSRIVESDGWVNFPWEDASTMLSSITSIPTSRNIKEAIKQSLVAIPETVVNNAPVVKVRPEIAQQVKQERIKVEWVDDGSNFRAQSGHLPTPPDNFI
jgi:hypoxanthine phosphoribosyltransferase